MSRLLTVKQVAELCGVHEQTVRRAIRDGRLPSRRVGGRGGSPRGVRVPEEAVAEWAGEPAAAEEEQAAP